jgi:hypothetical protein
MFSRLCKPKTISGNTTAGQGKKDSSNQPHCP